MKYCAVFKCTMKVQIKRDVLVEIDKVRLHEIWDKPLKKWEIIVVERIDNKGKTADLVTYNEDIYMNVPVDAFILLG